MSDLKKGQSSSAPLEPNGNNYNAIDESNLKTEEPAFQRNSKANESSEEKVCRICLEEDNPETMIAPCLCKGGSKWVHRECLDEWRTNERDRAFSKCTECLFEYHLEPVDKGDGCCGSTPQERRRTLFYWMVSRDACLGIALQQLIIVALAVLISTCDPNRELASLVVNQSQGTTPNMIVWIYYAFGWFAFFVGLGLYGSIVMCMNKCDIKRAIPRMGPPSEADEESGSSSSRTRSNQTRSNTSNHNYFYNYTYNRMERDDYGDGYYHRPPRNSAHSSSTTFYRRARRRHYHRRRYYNDYYYGPTYYPMYIYPGNDGCCCCCYCCDSGTSHTSACCDDGCCDGCGHLGSIHSSMSQSSSSPSSGSGSGDGQHILLMVLLVVAIVLAIIGFFVGVVIVVIATQRITSRHIYLLQKRQLVEQFKVMDLQDYDLDKPQAPGENIESDGIEMQDGADIRHPPPSAPVMPTEDVQYLKNLGLMDR